MSTACPLHPSLLATATCEDCGKPVCEECAERALGRTWCAACLAARVNPRAAAAPPPPPPPSAGPGAGPAAPAARIKRAWLAGTLSFILPGLGNVYTGLVARGLAQFAAWWLVFAVVRASLPSIFLQFALMVSLIWLWVWAVRDAMRSARALNARGHGATDEEARSITRGPVDDEQLRLAGIALVVVGLLLFAQQVGGVWLNLLRFALPLGLIGAGAWVVHRARLKDERERARGFDAAGMAP